MTKLSVSIDNNGDHNNEDGYDEGNNYGEYLSHPSEGEGKHSLLKHSLQVASRARELLLYTKFQNSELGFLSGLLHDIGKLNPYYQILFRASKYERKTLQNKLDQKYEHVHSPYSAWIAEKLLHDRSREMDYVLLDKILMLIYGHHSRLRRSLGDIPRSKKFELTQQAMIRSLERFRSMSFSQPDFSELSWDNCLERFLDPISFDIQLKSRSKDPVDDYLDIVVAYSCLLQADRGSFSDWRPANFDAKLDTYKLIRVRSKLALIRDKFQRDLATNFQYHNPISIIHAPTGIGKTKVFLDLIGRYRSKFQSLERIFYFSPLLALTEDFEIKVSSTASNLDEVLIYNHLFSGSLEEKRKLDESGNPLYQSDWIFDNESFNKPFIITTTQRLLITIFSNKHADKLKLASLRNSLLIIDEIQTIPKYILKTLIHILEKMFHFMGTRTLLVSATIPYELNTIPIVKVSNQNIRSYLDLTKKNVSFVPWSKVNIQKGKTLVMANTRRKAANIFYSLNAKFPNALYLSSGIRKKDRISILSQIREKGKTNDPFILISTQVVEAGVDLSFSQVFREKAPLDSIIQVMGRLNREAEDDQANLVVYDYDKNHKPYSQLEFKESEERLGLIKNSIDLYSSLPEYYQSISEKNNLYKEYTEELNNRIAKLDFDGIWEFINNHVFLEEDRDTVLIPESEQWNKIKEILIRKDFRLTKAEFRMFSSISASLPKTIYELGIQDYFDEDGIERNILLPKKEYLSEVYDSTLGTDKWLIQ